jgi:hypothetical protein
MKSFMRFPILIVFLGFFVAAVSASADTLEMKDGRVINGTYLGGTKAQVRFSVNGKTELYPVGEILALTFGGEAKSAESPATSPAKPNETPAAAEHSGSAKRVTVPVGTPLLVRMIDSVDSEKNKIGDRFRASLEEDLVVGDVVVAPKGTDVYGRLAEAKEAGHVSGKSQLKLELTDILINQQLQPIVSGDYEVSGKSRGSQSAMRIGGGAALGAAIGAIAGGGKGAAIGAGVGAGAGTAVQVLTKGEQVRVPSETMLEFRLEQPLTVEPARPTAH